MKKHLFLLLLVNMFCVTLAAQVFPEWVTRYDGIGDYSDKIHCIKLDILGNIYLGGYSVNISRNRDFLLIKLNPSGDTLWKRMFDGQGNGPDEVSAMTLDYHGNIIVTGFQKGNGTGDDILTIKYNPNGDTLWTRVYDYTVSEDDDGNSVAVDTSGNVYVAGKSDLDPSTITNDDYVLIKYDSTGAQQWVQRYNGSGNGTDRAVKVLVDASQNVIITGRSANNYDDDYVTIKYNPAGVQQWLKVYDAGHGHDRAVDMVLDEASNVYVTGRSDNGADDDYMTVKYNAAGVYQWEKRYDGLGAGDDHPTAMAIDANDNIYVTGKSDIAIGTPLNDNYLTVKYNSAGTQQWTATYNGSGNGEDIADAICVDALGNVYVTGESDSNPSASIEDKDYVTIKYNTAGDTAWVRKHGGNANSLDVADAIAVDNSGNVFISGECTNTVSQKDAVTIKYNASGVQQWLKTFIGEGDNYDNANAITTDAAGNIYVAGYSVSTDLDRDMCTIKMNSSGDTLWVRKYNGTSNFRDEATAIKVDALGNVYVTGFTKNSGTSCDYTTIKYNASGDTLWVRKYNSPIGESDKAWALDVDASGNVYITGESDGDPSLSSNDDYCTVKYNSAGVYQWAVRFNGTGNGTDRPVALKIGPSGNFYVTGRSKNAYDDDYVTIKYNSSGSLLWKRTYNSTYGDDQPATMYVDAKENIYVTGYSKNISTTNEDYLTIKYDSAGTQKWVARYNGTANNDDHPKAVIADASGNVYVTGESAASASIITKDYDYLTIKYDSSGTEKWHKIYDGLAGGDDEATSMALDDSNNVYITGQCDNGSTGLINLDYVTIKYDTAGNQKWCAVYNGIGNGDDGAKAITVMNGSVFVAGGSWGIGTQKDLTVLKYLCVPTGINEYSLNQNEGFIVYPNPANDFLIIKNIMDNKPMIISISDFTGRNVVNITSAKNSETTIATRLLNQGIYFLNINNTYFKKIEILH